MCVVLIAAFLEAVILFQRGLLSMRCTLCFYCCFFFFFCCCCFCCCCICGCCCRYCWNAMPNFKQFWSRCLCFYLSLSLYMSSSMSPSLSLSLSLSLPLCCLYLCLYLSLLVSVLSLFCLWLRLNLCLFLWLCVFLCLCLSLSFYLLLSISLFLYCRPLFILQSFLAVSLESLFASADSSMAAYERVDHGRAKT